MAVGVWRNKAKGECYSDGWVDRWVEGQMQAAMRLFFPSPIGACLHTPVRSF